MVGADDLAASKERRRIGDLPRLRVVTLTGVGVGAVNEADDRRRCPRALGKSSQCSEVGFHEIPSVNQVFRGIAGQGQFGKEEHVGAYVLGAVHCSRNGRLIPNDVADCQVDLGPGHAQTHTRRIRLAATSSLLGIPWAE